MKGNFLLMATWSRRFHIREHANSHKAMLAINVLRCYEEENIHSNVFPYTNLATSLLSLSTSMDIKRYLILLKYTESHYFPSVNNIRMCLFISMLCTIIKFEIDLNYDKLLGTIWEHTRKIKRGERRGDTINFE
jgi:hypothetical protein